MSVQSGVTDLCMNDPTDSSPDEDPTILLMFLLVLNPKLHLQDAMTRSTDVVSVH